MSHDAVDTREITTLTFDVVGTVIDFETGILEWWRPDLPFTDMPPLIYHDLAETWSLAGGQDAAKIIRSAYSGV